MDFQLIKIQMGIKSAVKIKKNKETPSKAKTPGPHWKFKAGETIHSIRFIIWNCPSKSKAPHKTKTLIKIAKDHSSATFFNLTLSSLETFITLIPPIKSKKKTRLSPLFKPNTIHFFFFLFISQDLFMKYFIKHFINRTFFPHSKALPH